MVADVLFNVLQIYMIIDDQWNNTHSEAGEVLQSSIQSGLPMPCMYRHASVKLVKHTLIALSSFDLDPRPSAPAARNPGSTTSEIAAARPDRRSQGGTVEGKKSREYSKRLHQCERA